MPNALVFSKTAAGRFQAGLDILDDWTSTYQFGTEDELATVLHGNAAYVFEPGESTVSASIVVRLAVNKLFSCFVDPSSRLEALKRSIDAGMMVLEGGGALPSYWRPFTQDQFMSFQALPLSKGDARRLVLWRRLAPLPDPCVFIFDVTTKQSDYVALAPDFQFLKTVIDDRAKALASLPRRRQGPQLGPQALQLRPLSEQVDAVTHGWKLGYLYQSRLTKQQREFVDAPLDRPIRLKGAAGTGKTLAMVAKLLREAKIRREGGSAYRFLFLTHNASAAELAERYAIGLDEDDLLTNPKRDELIRIDTLLGLAIRELSEDLGDLRPISSDAHEGKQLQLLTLSDIITSYARGAWITRKRSASRHIQEAIEASSGARAHEEFCWDAMNEIATVLDADGVRDNAPKRDDYLNTKRPQRLMPLPTIADREVMLDVYDRYRAELKSQGLISVDQLTSDYLGFLDSFRWDARRNRMGYDALFVDEFHLFSALERLTFRSLLRNGGPHPVILIALDPRQSPRAVFLSVFGDERPEFALGIERPAALARGEAEQLRDFEFNQVFRYTPEIAELLTFVNSTFPETDLAEEWLPSAARSALPSGERPIAHETANRQELYDYAVQKAQSSIRKFGRGKIAILTLSQAAFQEIKNAGRYANKLYVVDSRDSLSRLQYVGGRIVLSMPEYVAGVQFDHVLVADVNDMDDLGRHTAVTRDRFGSNLYLAVSRARQAVTILGHRRAGGLAPVIGAAAARNILTIE